MLKLYASWGLDFIKVDCISDHPYRPTEIRQIAEAIRKTGRPIVLSLSPGPTQLEHAAEVAKYAQMWRITDDHWDGWTFKHKSPASEFPFGLKDEFDRIAQWAPYVKPGNWPDPDMLRKASSAPIPARIRSGQPATRTTSSAPRFTLWAISRSPLILGTNLTKLDDFTRSLITNKEVLDLNQQAVESKPGLLPNQRAPTQANFRPALLVRAHRRRTSKAVHRRLQPRRRYDRLKPSLDALPPGKQAARSLTTSGIRSAPQRSKTLRVELPPHACALFRVE